jgi:hypothetical protein
MLATSEVEIFHDLFTTTIGLIISVVSRFTSENASMIAKVSIFHAGFVVHLIPSGYLGFNFERGWKVINSYINETDKTCYRPVCIGWKREPSGS